MPVGAGSGAASGRALGCEWRPIETGTPAPMDRPWNRISTVSMSKGSKMTSTRDPTSAASTSKALPCKEIVAVFVTVRVSDHKERLVERGGGRKRRRSSGEQPVDGRLAGLCVAAAVIDGLHPRAEQPVELGQVLRRPRLHLDKELDAHRLEDSFDFPPAFRPSGLRVHEAHTEARARPQQL